MVNVYDVPAAEYNVGNQSVMCISCLETRRFRCKLDDQIKDALLMPPCHNVFFVCEPTNSKTFR